MDHMADQIAQMEADVIDMPLVDNDPPERDEDDGPVILAVDRRMALKDESAEKWGMIGYAASLRQAAVLRRAEHDAPVLQARVVLGREADEWERAADTLRYARDEWDEDRVIGVLPLCSVVPHMVVFTHSHGPAFVIRRMENGGQTTLHVEPDDRPAPMYLNMVSKLSPVVVVA